MRDLCGADLLQWMERQAQVLREHAACDIANDGLDWLNLAEAIKSRGASQTERNSVTRCRFT